ncbi:MAG: TonB family protein [Bacteroidetes bacterium]|nr:TonB family protein [Bacteroidota bacterium]
METIKSHNADLENKIFIFREIGLIIALMLVFLAFNLKSHDKATIDLEVRNSDNITEEIIPITIQEIKQPPPPPATKSVIINIVENTVEVENDIEINADADQETYVPDYTPTFNIEDEEEEIIEDEEIFVVVESMPSFPGGMNKLMEYLQNNLRYPQLAKELNIQGRVFLTFVIKKDGSVTDIKLLRGIGGGCDEEAIRVVNNMPKWTPGSQRNKPVRVQFNLPVNFRLE